MESIDFLTDNTHSTLDCSPIVALCWRKVGMMMLCFTWMLSVSHPLSQQKLPGDDIVKVVGCFVLRFHIAMFPPSNIGLNVVLSIYSHTFLLLINKVIHSFRYYPTSKRK